MIIKEVLFPRRCPVCDRPVRWGTLICGQCDGKIKVVKPPICMKCGKHILETEEEYCQDCKRKKHIFTRGLALYEYNSVNQAIYRFKYKNRAEYADYFGKCMAARYGKLIKTWNVDGIIPVPLHKSKLRYRGYNQAQLLGESLSKEVKIPIYTDVIERKRKTVPMKELDPLRRQINLKNAFIIRRFDVKLERVIIVDDIYTTGSSIDEVSRELRKIGVKEIFFLTLAIGTGM